MYVIFVLKNICVGGIGMKERIKRHWQKLVIGILVILLVLVSLQLYDLSQTVSELKANYSNSINNLHNNINSIYDNVDEKLKEQASLLSYVDFAYGEFDRKTNKVPVTIKVIPKLITDDMQLSIKVGKDNIIFVREGNEFTAEFEVYIFTPGDNRCPVLNIKSGDEIKTELLEGVEVYDLRYRFIPSVYTSVYDVSASFSEGNLVLNGNYNVYCETVDSLNTENCFENMYITYELNGKEIKREQITEGVSGNSYDGSVNEAIKVKNGDCVSMYTFIEDIEGYNMKKEISRFNIKNDSVIEELFGDEQSGKEIIYEKSGKIIYQN